MALYAAALVQVQAYRLKLPPKRLFVHNPTPDFVEERRQQLDTYLQMLLQERQLQGVCDLFLHLNACIRTTPADCLGGPGGGGGVKIRPQNVG